jgi:[CysO sulfur-carrier protein]-S-L-cysteine hydrolase
MIRIHRSVYDSIIDKARQGAPLETCGLLAGQDDVVILLYELTNLDASPEHFSLDPKEQLSAIKDARSRGLKIIGVVHSHPTSPARPSAEDIRLAFDPDQLYFIISLAGKEPELKAFIIRPPQVQEERLALI